MFKGVLERVLLMWCGLLLCKIEKIFKTEKSFLGSYCWLCEMTGTYGATNHWSDSLYHNCLCDLKANVPLLKWLNFDYERTGTMNNQFNPGTLYLIHDQPTTCAICGTRCEFLADFWHTNAKWFIMQCLNNDCEFIFLSGEGEEDLKLLGLK